MKYIFLFFFLNFVTLTAHAQKNEGFDETSMSFYTENDFLSSNKDNDFTAGAAVSFSGSDAKEHPISIDGLLSSVNQLLNLEDEETVLLDPLYSCEMGLNLFTPTEITQMGITERDRPYASLFYVANGQQSLDLQHKRSWTSSLTLGFLGLNLAEDIQTGVHSVIGSEKPRGWDHQISSGGEPTLKYEITRSWFYELNSYLGLVNFASGSLGFLTEGSLGSTLRIGRIRSPWWTIDSNQNRIGSKTNPNYFYQDNSNDSYFLLGVQGKARLYNAFNQGQFRDSDLTYSFDELNPFLFEAWGGWTQEISNSIKLSYIIRFQTSEFREGLADRNSTWGGIVLSMNLD